MDDYVIVNGEKYVRERQSGPRKIVVAERGFVFVGNVSEEGDKVIIDNCDCIRRWGTTKGLGELATSGPLKDTVLDPQPRTVIHNLRVVHTIDCEADKWPAKR